MGKHTPTLAWHFVNDTLRDGSPIPEDGATLKHEGKLEMCASGFHASKRITDALVYAPGNTICRVRLSGEIVKDDDKMVAQERTILWRVDGEPLLREYARWCALQVIHLWDAPAIVREYLETGDDTKRAAAWDAAWAAWAAAWDAARAAWVAARAACDAACDARAAWDAARAARDAACDAAWDAAWAARDAAREAQEKKLTELVMLAARATQEGDDG